MSVVKRRGAADKQPKPPGGAPATQSSGVSNAAQLSSSGATVLGNLGHAEGAADTAGPSETQPDAAPAGVNASSGSAPPTSMPGAEVAELVTAENVIGGQLEGASGSVLPRHATAHAVSGCLGLQYDSDDDSDED